MASKTTLEGAAIASTADQSNNYFRTGSLEWKDIVNEAKFKATQASVSGGGGSSGGSGSGSFQQKSDTATSIIHAGLANGTLIVEDGSGLDIARGVNGLRKDGLKEIFDAREVSEQLQIQQVAGEMAFEAVGDIATAMRKKGAEDTQAAQAKFEDAQLSGNTAGMAQAMADIQAANTNATKWKDGSANRIALHVLAGAVQAAFGGGGALPAAAGAGVAEYVAGQADSSALAIMGGLVAGAAAGGARPAASSVLAGTSVNRLLHKEEETAIAELLAKGYEKSTINAVACYEVKCWKGDPSLGLMNVEVERVVTAAIEAMGPQKQEELLEALRRKAPGQFEYKTSDYLEDGWKDNNLGAKLRWLGSTALDLAPAIGDAKAYYEAETASDYYWATVGLIPFGGDAARKIAKRPVPKDTLDSLGNAHNYWSSNLVAFDGKTVYQRPDIIDPARIDAQTGLTNMQLMQRDLAPYGPDGKKINLHHMLQSEDGPIVELTQTFHQQNSHVIHINSGSSIPSGVDRKKFEKWKRDYWQSRSGDFD